MSNGPGMDPPARPGLPGGGDDTFDPNGCSVGNPFGGSCSGVRVLAGPTFTGGRCCYSICQGPVPPCGRPLVVEGLARVAGAAARHDWLVAAGAPSLDDEPRLRERLRAAWLADAAAEHASVASFARFALELLAAGAPPDLVAAAHRAALDEVEHARICFTLAAAYGGASTTQGPGALPLGGLVIRTRIDAIVAAAVVEGCIGETVASLALSRARELCKDRFVATALEKMATDEQRHAELAWRFVAWSLGQGDVSSQRALAQCVRHAFERGLAEVGEAPAPWAAEAVPGEEAAWRAAGRLDRAELEAVVREARERVIGPGMGRLLG